MVLFTGNKIVNFQCLHNYQALISLLFFIIYFVIVYFLWSLFIFISLFTFKGSGMESVMEKRTGKAKNPDIKMALVP